MRVLIACTLLALGSSALAAQPRERSDLGQAAQLAPSGLPDEPIRISGNVTAPEKIGGDAPAYTDAARAARLQGVVVLEAIIDEHGNVADVRILKPLPMGLGEAAQEAVSSWKFKPAWRESGPVKVFYTLTVNFQMDDNGDTSDPPVLFGRLSRERAAASPPADAEVIRQLAADLAAGRQTLDAVAKRAEADYGDKRAALLIGIGGSLWGQATSPTATPQAKAHLLELTDKVVDLAHNADDALPETLALKALLLREEAKAATDPAVRADLNAQSAQWFDGASLIYQQANKTTYQAAP